MPEPTSRHAFDPDLVETANSVEHSVMDDVVATRLGVAAMYRSVVDHLDTTGVIIEDRTVPGAPGDPDVAVRIYRPEAQESTAGGVLSIHGGGFVTGDLDADVGLALVLVGSVGAVVVSVDYRLAPEHPFPAGLDDCYAALAWFHDHAGELDVDPDRLAVFGMSAGGGLAAALALLARDRGGPPLCFQFLGIPELDDRLETPSMVAFDDTPMWHRRNAELSWQYYLGLDPGADHGEVSPYAAPARATDLAGLPRAYVSTMEFDPLRDEGLRYGMAMLEAGVPVEIHQFAGTFHGSVVAVGAWSSRRQIDELIDVMTHALS